MFNTKFILSCLALFATLICSCDTYAQSDVFLTGEIQTIGIGPNESFSILAESNTGTPVLVDGLVLFLDVLSIPTAPVVNVNGDGIFSGASVVFTPADLSSSSLAEASISIPFGAAILDPAPIAEIFFDTTALSDGDEISFGFVDGINTTTFLNADTPVETNILLTFTAIVAVPEPSSAAIFLALGCAGIARRRRN